MNREFQYGNEILTILKVVQLAEGTIRGVLSDDALAKIRKSQQYVSEIVSDNKTVYGINTGFGVLANTHISAEDTRTLQHKILQSHSVGVGKPISPFLSKIMMITKVHSLAQGYSGVQVETLERICWFIDQDICPVVPEKGSVGASGDLAPLAHLFLPLIGLGEVWVKGKIFRQCRCPDRTGSHTPAARPEGRSCPDQWYSIYTSLCRCQFTKNAFLS